MHLRDIQKLTWDNKVAKSFNTTHLPLEFALAPADLSEAFEAARKSPEHLGEELVTRLAACRLDYLYASGPETAADLLPKEADAG